MADSDDGEYVADDMSEDDFADHQVTSSKSGLRARRGGGGGSKKARPKKDKAQAWETVKRPWETVFEDNDGQLALAPYLDAEKRKRLLKDTTPLQRGIIRHLMLVVDMSFAMAEKDMLPTRYRLAMSYAKEFVREYFEQNPISQMGIVGMRDGVALMASQMSGNPAEHLERLEYLRNVQEPLGSPSLQNALEMCRGVLL
jgi:transcription initiation factor TFIIH subunit 2